jgi:D-alanyl-D-alanine carboxypeptidase (penicillin-binding protein 5/6)
MRRGGALAALCCLVTTCYLAVPSAAAPPPAVDARAGVLEDGCGQVLAAANAGRPRAIASITKLMTVLVVLDHRRLSDVVTVDARAAAVGQESIALEPGEQLTVADLIRGALIQSANDAAVALALATSPNLPAFANVMNAKARALGLRHSHFVRPDGLDAPGEHASAADVTTLAREAMRVPFIRRTVAESTAVIGGGRVLHTWNDLLGVVPGVIGVKTGHTDDAGWSQVAADRSDGMTIYATILGSPTRSRRNADLERLLSWAEAEFRPVDALRAGRAYAAIPVPYGQQPLELVTPTRLRAVLRPGQPLTERVVAPTFATLPVRRGDVLGRIEVWSGRHLLGKRPLVAARDVRRPGLAGRARWYARRTVHHIADLFS